MARIKVVGHLSKIFGFKEKHLEFSGTMRIKDLVPEGYDLSKVAILKNQKSANPETTFTEKDDILFLPHVGGG